MTNSPQHPNESQREGIGGSFWRRAKLTTQDQPDGGDTWHISKKDFNAYMDDVETLLRKERLEGAMDELYNADVDKTDRATFDIRMADLTQQLKDLEKGD